MAMLETCLERNLRRLTAVVISAAVFLPSFSPAAAGLNLAQEFVLFYPTYGVPTGDDWEVEVRLWVYEERAFTTQFFEKLATSSGDVTPAQRVVFERRIRHFVADSESRETVEFQFDHDPMKEIQRLRGPDEKLLSTDANGNLIGLLRLSRTRAAELLTAQKSKDGWLTITAVSAGHRGTGRIQLIEPQGLSIISDIDDTLRVTEMPAGARVVSANTFLREFVPAKELRPVFEKHPEAVVHYVSAGPWQLCGVLDAELIQADEVLPDGTFHMRTVRTNFLTVNSWKDLGNVIFNKDGTLDHKVSVISRIIKQFPERTFLLLGDSGERDPEVYRTIQKTFPEQIQEIMIRDVVNDREKNPDRLRGMTIVPAPTVVPGKSELADE